MRYHIRKRCVRQKQIKIETIQWIHVRVQTDLLHPVWVTFVLSVKMSCSWENDHVRWPHTHYSLSLSPNRDDLGYFDISIHDNWSQLPWKKEDKTCILSSEPIHRRPYADLFQNISCQQVKFNTKPEHRCPDDICTSMWSTHVNTSMYIYRGDISAASTPAAAICTC